MKHLVKKAALPIATIRESPSTPQSYAPAMAKKM